MSKEKKKILTIAGFDPSGGAGVLADIKTFEAHQCLGFAILTANTIQNENEFITPNWIDEKIFFNQLNIIIKEHTFHFVKVGLIPSLNFLEKTIEILQANNPKTKIIWDPILSASAGFNFEHDLTLLHQLLKKIYLITPNWNEIKLLSKQEEVKKGAEQLSLLTNIYLKGGHNAKEIGKDYLYTDNDIFTFNPKVKVRFEKHGSGCVFSSALTANLLIGYPLRKACLRSKNYINKFLNSSFTKLGHHKI